jgi:hypothetical protein
MDVPVSSTTDRLGTDPHLLGNVSLVDSLLNLCFDIHPVLLPEHGLPPVDVAISEGKPLCSSRGTFYFGVSKTLIIDAEISPLA